MSMSSAKKVNYDDLPIRSFMEDKNIIWKSNTPDYELVDRKYLREKTRSHQANSLEKIVENIVKTWEMECSHKVNEKDWETIDKGNFTISINGGKKYTLQDIIEVGNYNMSLEHCPLYNAATETYESSQEIFREAFINGYAWELLDVQSGPPVVSFTWRHWGNFEGPYRDVSPTNESLEMFGSCVVKVTDQLKIQSVEVFFDPNPTMATLTGFKTTHGQGCPFRQ